jgi:CMP-N,N'-diacetyllegionaminic acid synthase
MSNIVTICARGGSKELPRKNILPLCGKPLIVYTIEQALKSQCVDHVFVSTDDVEIAQISKNAGAEVPFIRPSNMASDIFPKHPVVEHCVKFALDMGINVEKIIDLQPTSPIRSENDIEDCLKLLKDDIDVVFSVKEAKENPYFIQVECFQGSYQLSKLQEKKVVARQKAPKVYAMNGSIYAWHLESLYCGLWGGKSNIYIMPEERSLDIDTYYDFELAKFLLKGGV